MRILTAPKDAPSPGELPQAERWGLHLLNTPLAVIEWGVDGRVLSWNPAAERMFGYSSGEAVGQPIIDLIVPPKAEVLEQVHTIASSLLDRGGLSKAEHENRRKDGSQIFCRWFNTPLADEKGQSLGVASIALDVTDLHLATLALVKSEQRFRIVADFTHDWEYWIAPDGSIPWMSPSCERMTGYSVDDFQRDPVLINRICHPEDRSLFMAHNHEINGELKISPIEFRIHHRDGRLIWFSHICAPVLDESGALAGRRATNHDITDRKDAETVLWESEQRFRTVFEQAIDGIVIISTEGQIIDLNESYARMHGYTKEEMLGLHLHDTDSAESYRLAPDRLRRILAGEGITVELGQVHKDGHRFTTEATGNLVSIGGKPAILSYHRDITERKQAEQDRAKLQSQLLQAQKMESLGVLAGGVAHDMNNVLGAILGLASANIGAQAIGSPLHQALDTICKAAERGGKMVQSLLNFARQNPSEDRCLDLNAILREQIGLLERTTLAKVRLRMELEAALRPIKGDPSALANALMNLCVNAVDAMPENGTLTLHSRNADDDWVEVVVEDTGTGMPRVVLERAMEPFFTTKGTGKGTGLGLSMVYSTVKAHQGKMNIQSEPGQGTRVTLRFPACRIEVQAVDLTVQESTGPSRRTVNVLLVDDDELIRSALQALLESLGHSVTISTSGEEALATLEAGFGPDLVILDLNMPGLGGAGTLPPLRRLCPRVPVILSTGRADETALALTAAYPCVTLLAKPYGLKALQACLEGIWPG